MRNGLIASILVALALLATSPGMHAQTSAKPGPGAASAIPDLSGNWEAHRQVPITAATALCGIRNVCNGLLGISGQPMGERSEEPEMQPWAAEKYKAVKEGRVRNPTFAGCMPE